MVSAHKSGADEYCLHDGQPPGSFVNINGLRTHILDKGNGFPLILLHGISSSFYTWRNNVDVLSQYFRVIAPDLPGYGFSAKPLDFRYDYDGYVSFINGLMQGMKLEKAHFVGHSFGASVCQVFAKRLGAKIGRLMLVSSGDFRDRKLGANEKVLKNLLLHSYTNKSIITKEMLRLYEEINATPNAPNITNLVLEAIKVPIKVKKEKIENKCMILWGADDNILPPKKACKLLELFQEAQVEIIPDCGHVPQEEKSTEFNELALRFLSN